MYDELKIRVQQEATFALNVFDTHIAGSAGKRSAAGTVHRKHVVAGRAYKAGSSMCGFRGKGNGFAMERIHLFHGPLAYATGLVERKYTRHGNGVGPFTCGNVILKFNVRYANPADQQ